MLSNIFRFFSDFKGKQRIAQIIFRKTINRSKNIIIKGKYGCSYRIPNLKEVIGFELYINGIFEELHVHLIRSRLPLNAVFIDIGANIGSISVPICKLRPDISCYAVEASSSMIDYLSYNLSENKIENCRVLHKAIWDKSNELMVFNIPEIQFGKGSISFSDTTNMVERVLSLSIDDLVTDNLIYKVDFIKIDIEGFEYFALKGAKELLRGNHAPDILFEFIDSAENNSHGLAAGDAQAFLIGSGYKLFALSGKKMLELRKPMYKGYSMILATKRVF